jgi:hypothetical protein
VSRGVRSIGLAFVAVLLLALASVGGLSGGTSAARSIVPSVQPAAAGTLTGNISGPTVLATSGTQTYQINATGGPAFSANGTKVGNLTFYASVAAANTTGVAVSPDTGNLTGTRAFGVSLGVGATAETVTVTVLIASVYQKSNQSINLTYLIHVVTPYVLAAEIVNGPLATVLTFPVLIYLDGSVIASVTVPTLTPGGTYNLSYDYATLGLSPGDHTFSISLANEHGLVRFANGQTSYSATFYVTEPASNYTWWYVAGVVVFFGVLFIFATRLAARRRGSVRK